MTTCFETEGFEEGETENLTGLVVAFYDIKKCQHPADYYCLGHVKDCSGFRYDESLIINPIQVTDLQGDTLHYFGMTSGGVWRLLLEDLPGDLVVCGHGPVFEYDIIS